MGRAEAKEARKLRVLDAVEESIRRDGTVNFSMRELAANAEVSFATPFNLFGKKEDILAALFNKRVTDLALRSDARTDQENAIAGLLMIAEESCIGYLSDAQLFKPLARAFRTQSTPQLEAISKQAQAIWQRALERCEAERMITKETDIDSLSRRIHLSFRVAFWMWAADELTDLEFREQALFNTAACLLPPSTAKGKKALTAALEHGFNQA